jgi:hypothetical protein
MWEVMKKEVLRLLHVGITYPMSQSDWVSPVQVVPKKEGMMVVENNKNGLIPQCTVMG